MNKRLASLVLCTLIGLATGACAKADGTGSPDATPFPGNQGELNRVADAVTAAGTESFADVFAGVEIDTGQGVVVVWRKPSAAFDSYVAGQAWRSSVRTRDAKHSRIELQVALGRLLADIDYWKNGGISLELRARQDGACVEVGAAEPAEAQTRLSKHYPGMPLCFVPAQGRAPLGRSSPTAGT